MSLLLAKAIIFDLDGVLADSTAAVDGSWRMWAARHGVEPLRAIAVGHGRTTIEALRIIAPELDANEGFAEMEAFEESQIESVVPINGAPEFVRRVIELGIPWAVATSGTRRIAIPRLQAAQIPDPSVLITADEIAHGKPHPEPYEKAAASLGVAPWECVVFEDAPAGILSARRAGATVIGINAHRKLLDCDDSAIDFEDVELNCYRSREYRIKTLRSHFRCVCCSCHTLPTAKAAMTETCELCTWLNDGSNGDYSLAEAQKNVKEYGVKYRPTDERFAPARHPILGPNGEYAIDRVALRARAYREFEAFGEGKDGRAHLPERLEALLAAIRYADALYNHRTL